MSLEYIVKAPTEIKEKNAAFRYVVPYKDLFHKSAIKILTDDDYNCKYVLV